MHESNGKIRSALNSVQSMHFGIIFADQSPNLKLIQSRLSASNASPVNVNGVSVLMVAVEVGFTADLFCKTDKQIQRIRVIKFLH